MTENMTKPATFSIDVKNVEIKIKNVKKRKKRDKNIKNVWSQTLSNFKLSPK